MRTWQRAPVATLCGGPCLDTVIPRGEPVLTITVPGLKAVRFRCRHCAGEPVPDLPALVEHASVRELAPMVPARVLAKGAALPFDWKAKRIVEREPGCDDE